MDVPLRPGFPGSADIVTRPRLGRRNLDAAPASPCPECYMPGRILHELAGVITWICDRCTVQWQRRRSESVSHGAWLNRHLAREAKIPGSNHAPATDPSA